jgi:hypothetical protein
VGGNCCADLRATAADKVHRVGGGDVFEYNAKPRESAHNRLQVLFDKGRLAIEDIDLGFGDLAVDQQRQVDFFHDLQHRVERLERMHAGGRIGRCAGGVELDAREPGVAAASRISSGRVPSVRYRVIRAQTAVAGPAWRAGCAGDTPQRDARVLTGGIRLGITMTRPM